MCACTAVGGSTSWRVPPDSDSLLGSRVDQAGFPLIWLSEQVPMRRVLIIVSLLGLNLPFRLGQRQILCLLSSVKALPLVLLSCAYMKGFIFQEVRDPRICEAMSLLHTEHVRKLTAGEPPLDRERTHVPPGTVSGSSCFQFQLMALLQSLWFIFQAVPTRCLEVDGVERSAFPTTTGVVITLCSCTLEFMLLSVLSSSCSIR